MNYFANCYTPEEIKQQYHFLAKRLHPDKGGSKSEFQQMQNEYENCKLNISYNESKSTLPNYFENSGIYEYFRRPVKYSGIYYNHYYKFSQDFGADILIDIDHINLIFTKRKML